MIQVNNLTFSYHKDESILNGISFDADDNCPVAILGPSGCGKTTLLKCLYGTLIPDDGDIKIKNDSPNNARKNKKIGVAFQESALIQWKNVKENIIFPNTIGKQTMTNLEVEERVQKLLEVVNLKGFEEYYPSELSGGMKQRVNLARALFTKPNLLLLDEPFASLDLLTRTKIALKLKELVASINIPSILVTHSIEEAIIFAKKIIILTHRPSKKQEEIMINFEINTIKDLEKQEYLEMVSKCRTILMKNMSYEN